VPDSKDGVEEAIESESLIICAEDSLVALQPWEINKAVPVTAISIWYKNFTCLFV